jgi:hypothetical protein
MGERARAWFASDYDFERPLQALESYLLTTTQTREACCALPPHEASLILPKQLGQEYIAPKSIK